MGYKKPENRGWKHHYDSAPVTTVAMMRRDGWTIVARCPVCHLDCWVSLKTIERMSPWSGETRLWNATTGCRRLGCPGRAFFLATPPGEELAFRFALMDPPS